MLIKKKLKITMIDFLSIKQKNIDHFYVNIALSVMKGTKISIW